MSLKSIKKKKEKKYSCPYVVLVATTIPLSLSCVFQSWLLVSSLVCLSDDCISHETPSCEQLNDVSFLASVNSKSYEVRNRKISVREFLNKPESVFKTQCPIDYWSPSENIMDNFLFLKREEEAWVYKAVPDILNFCFVFKVWLYILCLCSCLQNWVNFFQESFKKNGKEI